MNGLLALSGTLLLLASWVNHEELLQGVLGSYGGNAFFTIAFFLIGLAMVGVSMLGVMAWAASSRSSYIPVDIETHLGPADNE